MAWSATLAVVAVTYVNTRVHVRERLRVSIFAPVDD